MVCCKLDKIDKIFISILCIFVTFTCILNTFVFASERVNVQYKENTSIVNDIIAESDTQTLFYFTLEKGHKYTITNNLNSAYTLFIGDSIEYGTKLERKFTLNNLPYGQTIEFIADENYILGYYTTTDRSSSFVIEDITSPGFNTVIADLVGLFGFGALWEVFKNLIPYILVCVSVSLGFYFILHAIKEVSKGRDV